MITHIPTERDARSLCFSVSSTLVVCHSQLSPVPSAVTQAAPLTPPLPLTHTHTHLVVIYNPRSSLLTSRPSTKPVRLETCLHPGSLLTAAIRKPHPLHLPHPTLPLSLSLSLTPSSLPLLSACRLLAAASSSSYHIYQFIQKTSF